MLSERLSKQDLRYQLIGTEEVWGHRGLDGAAGTGNLPNSRIADEDDITILRKLKFS